MEKVDSGNLKLVALTLPWAFLRFLGRVVRRFFLVLGVLVALGILGYVGFEFIVESIDSRYSQQIDAHLGIDKNAISRLHDPAYFAEQSVIVSEDQKTVACISSPEHRILISDPAKIPPLFTNAILASEDKNFFTHEGIDKGAIVRALTKRIFQESRSGASTLTIRSPNIFARAPVVNRPRQKRSGTSLWRFGSSVSFRGNSCCLLRSRQYRRQTDGGKMSGQGRAFAADVRVGPQSCRAISRPLAAAVVRCRSV